MTIEMLHADCFAVLPDRKAEFDLIVTSPPYNAGKEYETKVQLDQYKEFAKRWVDLAINTLKENGSFWLNVGYTKVGENQTLPLSYLYYEACDLPLVQEIVWYYEGGMSYSKRFAHRTERWLWFAKNPSKVKFNLDKIRDASLNRTIDRRNRPEGKNPTDIWYFNRVTNNSGNKHGHPCPFPPAMIARIIEACSDVGDKVLDPFMGSGTVGFVAKDLGRSFLGIERERKYFLAARERVDGLVFTLE